MRAIITGEYLANAGLAWMPLFPATAAHGRLRRRTGRMTDRHPIAGPSFWREGNRRIAERGLVCAFLNAVVDALAHLGVKRIDMPVTPWKVWDILKEKGVTG